MIRLCAGLCLSLFVITTAQAQSAGFSGLNKDRAGRMEATIGVNEAFSWDRTGENGSSLDVDSDTGWAFSFAYNYDNHWNLGFAMDFSDANFNAQIVEEGSGTTYDIDHELSSYNGQLNLTYHFFEGKFTPFVQAGLGWSEIDSNVTDGLPSSGCWWDPFWGYYCNTYWDTYDASEFSYNVGVGLRYDLPNNVFLKATYSNLWMDLGSDDQMFEAARIELGFML